MPAWTWLLSFVVFGYVNTPRTWVAGELVTASMMNTLRDLFLEIEAGTAEMVKATLLGKTSAQLTSLLSASGRAAIAYDTTLASIVASKGGGAYEPIGGGDFHPSNAVAIAMGLN